MVKALGTILSKSGQCFNGKVIFDKYIPFNTVRVILPVDIGLGKDLATFTIEDADKKSFGEIHDYIKTRCSVIKA